MIMFPKRAFISGKQIQETGTQAAIGVFNTLVRGREAWKDLYQDDEEEEDAAACEKTIVQSILRSNHLAKEAMMKVSANMADAHIGSKMLINQQQQI